MMRSGAKLSSDGLAVGVVEHAAGLAGNRDDPMQRQPDIGLARQALGWEPAVQLEEGLENTTTYFDMLLSKAAAETER